MTPSWYDVLGVDPDADTPEIRAAWKTQVADLDPTDRRFRLLNKAAEVLLDDERRRAHDAELAEHAALDVDADPEGDRVAGRDGADDAADDDRDPVAAPVTAKKATPADAPASRALIVTVSLGVVAVIAVIAAVLTLTLGSVGDLGDGDGADGGLPDAREVAAARAAAEAAVVPVLSYDYRALEQGKQAALSYMTPDYADEYEQLFASVIAVNAPSTETVVTVDVKTSGIVRTGPGLVDVLLFVDRPTTNKQQTTPEIYKDQATLRMRDIDGEWLVDCILSGAGSTCE